MKTSLVPLGRWIAAAVREKPGDVNAVLEIIIPFVSDLPVVRLSDPCVECGEHFEPGDEVTWRMRWLPQGLIHAACR